MTIALITAAWLTIAVVVLGMCRAAALGDGRHRPEGRR